jgi:hypothetical protein
MPTPTERLAGILLGRPVVEWIDEERAAGHGYRVIARHLYERTSGQVDVSHETLRVWHLGSEKASA